MGNPTIAEDKIVHMPTISNLAVSVLGNNYGKSTNPNSVDSNIIYLDRHNLDCDGNAIKQFIFQGGRYNYQCAQSLGGQRIGAWGYNTGDQSAGGVIYLDRQRVWCPDNTFLTQFKGAAWNYWGLHFTYNFVCSQYPSVARIDCYDDYTWWNDPGNNIIYLDRHNVQCPDNYALKGFEGQTSNCGWYCTQFRYHFKCCSAISSEPTAFPIAFPTTAPIAKPTEQPTLAPIASPTKAPVALPTNQPVADPTYAPSLAPIASPTKTPTDAPIANPTVNPTLKPTEQPVATPTLQPVASPTLVPSVQPTEKPFLIIAPTPIPIASPTLAPTLLPSAKPIANPTQQPTLEPSAKPSVEPTHEPTKEPTLTPTASPTQEPTKEPTLHPISEPTLEPTQEPSFHPTPAPSVEPTHEPTETPVSEPTLEPISTPTFSPTLEPTLSPLIPPTTLSLEEQKDFLSPDVPNLPSDEVIVVIPSEEAPPASAVVEAVQAEVADAKIDADAAAAVPDVAPIDSDKPIDADTPLPAPEIVVTADPGTKLCAFTFIKAEGPTLVPYGCALLATKNLDALQVGVASPAAFICSTSAEALISEVDFEKLKLVKPSGESEISYIKPGSKTSVTWFLSKDATGQKYTYTSGYHPLMTSVHMPNSKLGNDAVRSIIIKSTADPKVIVLPTQCS